MILTNSCPRCIVRWAGDRRSLRGSVEAREVRSKNPAERIDVYPSNNIFCRSIPSLFLQSLACCARSFPASRPDPREAGGMLRGCAPLVLIFFGCCFLVAGRHPPTGQESAVAAAVCSYLLARQHKCSTPWACLSRTPGTRFISSLLSPVLLSHSLAQVPVNALVHDHRLGPACTSHSHVQAGLPVFFRPEHVHTYVNLPPVY